MADGEVLSDLVPGSRGTIQAGSIATGKLADGAVTAAKLASNAVATAKIADDAVTKAKLAGGFLKAKVIAGGAAGALTVTGIAVGDELVLVARLNRDATAGNIDLSEITSEFVVSANTITNTGGTDTTGDTLLVLYLDLT